MLGAGGVGWVAVSRLVVMTEGRGSPQSTHFELVSPNFILGMALGVGVPRAANQGCSGHDELDVVAKGWVVYSRLVVMTGGRVSPQSTHLGCVIESPVLSQLPCSGYGLLGAVNQGWVGRCHVYGFALRHVLVLGLVDGSDVKKVIDALRGRIDSFPGPWVVKWGPSSVCFVPGARGEVVVLC